MISTKERTLSQFPASHYSGCGNDFLLFDNREQSLPTLSSDSIRALCLAENVDGLIIICHSDRADCAMRFYNSDGFEAEMCGNGVRCLMQFLRQKCAYPRERLLLETMKEELVVCTNGQAITLELGHVTELGWNITQSYNKVFYTMHHLFCGVPHLVIFTHDLANINVEKVGRYFRRHKRFLPQGTNVNFVEKSGDAYCIRTYERGVEKETLACGTGVSASGYALAKLYHIESPITFQVASKEHLLVSFQRNADRVCNLKLTGPASWICDCRVFIDLETGHVSEVRKCI